MYDKFTEELKRMFYQVALETERRRYLLEKLKVMSTVVVLSLALCVHNAHATEMRYVPPPTQAQPSGSSSNAGLAIGLSTVAVVAIALIWDHYYRKSHRKLQAADSRALPWGKV